MEGVPGIEDVEGFGGGPGVKEGERIDAERLHASWRKVQLEGGRAQFRGEVEGVDGAGVRAGDEQGSIGELEPDGSGYASEPFGDRRPGVFPEQYDLSGTAVGDGMAWPLAWLPLSAFVIDAGLTLGRRLWRAERWWTAHAQHAYQGWARRIDSHVPVTLGYAAWTGLGVLLAIGLHSRPWFFMLAGVMAWYTSGALLWWCLQRRGAGNRRADRMEWRKE